MIRWLSRGPVSETSWLRFLLHPDPDCLVGLSARFGQQDVDGRHELSRNFSQVVSSIRVGRVHKLTRPNRLEGPDRTLCAELMAHGSGSIEFLDVGASDGITTLETAEMFRAQLHVAVRACLIDPFIRLCRYRAGLVVEYRTSDDSPVMVRVGPVGLQLSSLDTSRDPISRGFGSWYLSRAVFRHAMPIDATISLVNPLVAADSGISVLEWDVLKPNSELAGRFHAARASNVLNHSYFSASQITTALSNLHGYLREEGLLLTSRSHVSDGGETDHGAIWRKEGDRFIRQRSFGSGSEITELVERYRAM